MRDPVSACAQVGSRALIGSPLLSSAILVMAGPDLPGLALTLETLASQPGLKPRWRNCACIKLIKLEHLIAFTDSGLSS